MMSLFEKISNKHNYEFGNPHPINKNTISIITPSLTAKYIDVTIKSVLEQTIIKNNKHNINLEMCVVADGRFETFELIKNKLQSFSNEHIFQKNIETANYYECFAGNVKFKVKYREYNLGIGATLNDCLYMTSGETINWLSDDDSFVQNKIEMQYEKYLELIGKGETNFFLYAGYILKENDTGKILRNMASEHFDLLEEQKKVVVERCFVDFSTAFFPRNVFKIVGLFDPAKKFGEDYEWLIRAITCFDIKAIYMPNHLSYYGQYSTQSTKINKGGIQNNDNNSRAKVLKFKQDGIKYFPELLA